MSNHIDVLNKAGLDVPKKQKEIRAKEEQCVLDGALTMFDICIAPRGHYEDVLYCRNPDLLNDVRRGSTLICRKVPFDTQCHDPLIKVHMNKKDWAVEDGWWLRRGLQKFFDIYYEFFQHGDLTNGSFNGSYRVKFGKREKNKGAMRSTIFYNVEQAILKEGAQIDAYRLLKANGENAQVSYFQPLDAWAISSKNVCMLVRSPADFDLYVGDRYGFSKIIAAQWFRQIEGMDPEAINSLKLELVGKTMIGEFVGSPDHQHMVAYTEILIVFYALVDNNSSATCFPPLYAYAFFHRFGIPAVAASKLGAYSSVADLYRDLEAEFRRTAEDPIETGEEGSVVYFVRSGIPVDNALLVQSNEFFFGGGGSQTQVEAPPLEELMALVAAEQRTLSLGKLKTLEYRLFRKIREKLKSLGPDNHTEKEKAFVKEMRELVRDNTLPHPEQYYINIMKLAVEKLQNDPELRANFSVRYVDFITELRAEIEARDAAASASTPN